MSRKKVKKRLVDVVIAVFCQFFTLIQMAEELIALANATISGPDFFGR